VATILGFVGMIGFGALAFWIQSPWLGVLAVFMFLNCWSGLQQARALLRMSKLPRHTGFECPSCKTAPPIGNFWVCPNCRKPFDTFQTHATCPNCSARFDVTRCLDCGRSYPMNQWIPYIPVRPLG